MTTKATATVKGGFWPENGVASLASISGKGPMRRVIAMGFATDGLAPMRELALTLDGAAAGEAALSQKTRIEANSELGGKRTIETVTEINRVSVAGDVTEINADFLSLTTRTSFGASPAANKDGNPLGTR